MSRKVLILAGDTDGNIGDLAIVTATCERLQSEFPGTRIAFLTSRPERDSARLGITPISRGWRGLADLIKYARQADMVICGGGGLFQDDDSLLKMPYWAVRLACLRMVTSRMVGLSIGAGPLDHPVSRLFGRLALRTLTSVSVRDPLAHAVLQPLTRKTIEVVPDPAFLLRPYPEDVGRQVLEDASVPADKKLVGVAVRRWFHTNSNLVPHRIAGKIGLYRDRGRSSMSAFTRATATVLDDIVSQSNGHVVFLPTYNVPHENDISVCAEIAANMQAGTYSLLNISDPKLYKAVTGHVSVMLCGRMHPAILAAGMGIPVVGLSYNQKFAGMFQLLGQGHRCLSMADFVRNGETHRLTSMLREAMRQPSAFQPDTSALETSTRQFIDALAASVPSMQTADAVPRA